MKSNKNTNTKINLKINEIIDILLKSPIRYEKLLQFLDNAQDTFFDNPELEFELLISNGLPLEFDGDNIFLKTSRIPVSEQIFTIVDIETNGGSVKKGYQIIELGAIKYQNGKIIDKFESLVYAKEINEYIQEVTNITPSMLENSPREETVLKEFKLFLEDSVFVAHDIKFDYKFVSDTFEKYDLGKMENRKLCTIDLARRTIESDKYGLSSLKEILEINVDNHHRAYYDALSTAYILDKCFEKIDFNKIKTTEDLIHFSKNAKQLSANKKNESNKEKE